MEPVIMSGNVINTLADLQKRQAAIMNDTRLSDAGKSQEGQKLAAERNAYASKALSTFKGDWQAMRRAYGELKAEREAIAEKAAKQWDYVRLAYERQTAHGMIQAATSPQDVQAAYESISLGGDRHAMRAFAETAASVIGASKIFPDKAAQLEVRQAMQNAAAKLTSTPEMDAQRAAESKFSGEVAKLYQATQQAANEFYPASFLGANNPFMDLLQGVRISERVDPTTLATKRSVDLDWD